MAQVLWSAIDSGLTNDSCLKEISVVKELLLKMLQDIVQVPYTMNDFLASDQSELPKITNHLQLLVKAVFVLVSARGCLSIAKPRLEVCSKVDRENYIAIEFLLDKDVSKSTYAFKSGYS